MKKLLKIFLSSIFYLLSFSFSNAQNENELIQKIKAKTDLVNDYVADGKMKTDVAFIKAPIGKIKVFYKKPNQFKIKRENGISVLPKGGVSVNISSIIDLKDVVALSAGDAIINGTKTKIVKLLPTNENSDIVLSTLYIDETKLLVIKAITTTKENGTYQMELFYGAYANYNLPDKIIFSFNTKNYKMPRGVTLEFDDDSKADKEKAKTKSGKVEITYSAYTINKGVDANVFK